MQNQNLFTQVTPKPNQRQREKTALPATDPNTPLYYVRDADSEKLIPNFNPPKDSHVQHISNIRKITIIRRTADNEVTEFTPTKAPNNLKLVIAACQNLQNDRYWIKPNAITDDIKKQYSVTLKNSEVLSVFRFLYKAKNTKFTVEYKQIADTIWFHLRTDM